MKNDTSTTATMAPLLLRIRNVGEALSVSESLVNVFVRRGWLTPVRIPGVRATRVAREEVEELARKIRSGALEALAPGRSVRGRIGPPDAA